MVAGVDGSWKSSSNLPLGSCRMKQQMCIREWITYGIGVMLGRGSDNVPSIWVWVTKPSLKKLQSSRSGQTRTPIPPPFLQIHATIRVTALALVCHRWTIHIKVTNRPHTWQGQPTQKPMILLHLLFNIHFVLLNPSCPPSLRNIMYLQGCYLFPVNSACPFLLMMNFESL